MKSSIIRGFEKAFGCRVFRNSLPRGADIFFDIERHFGAASFRTVFDIGANIGQSAETYHKRFPNADIYSFEPVSSTFRELLSNAGRLPRAKPFNIGFGASNETANIGLNDDSKVNSISQESSGRSETIQIRRVDDFCRERSIGKIDFMKIDTEGYELRVLEGADAMLRAQAIDLLHIEAAPFKTDRYFVPYSELTDRMREYDYELFGIYEQQPHWNGDRGILFFNPVFIRAGLAKR